jgi:DUF1009 family protein
MAGSLTILPDPPPPPTPIGLIAGGGRLPIIIAENLRRAGHPVHALGLANQYDPILPTLCDSFRTVPLLRLGTWSRLLREIGVSHAVMVGKVDKAKLMYDPLRVFKYVPDLRTLIAWFKHLRYDRRSYAVLGAIADELGRDGIHLLDSTASIPSEMATAGVMGRVHPTNEQQADIQFAWPLLVDVLRLDIGQAVAVRERDTLAVEAIEGTDAMIERTGRLCRAGGWTLCKGARAGHDRRSDVPTIGVKTIEHMHRHGGRCLALAAGDVIMIDKAHVLDTADRLGVALVGVPMASA